LQKNFWEEAQPPMQTPPPVGTRRGIREEYPLPRRSTSAPVAPQLRPFRPHNWGPLIYSWIRATGTFCSLIHTGWTLRLFLKLFRYCVVTSYECFCSVTDTVLR